MDRTPARAGVLTVIFMTVIVACIHLHDAHLKNTPLSWISGPVAHFMRLYGTWWEIAMLGTTAIVLFIVFYQLIRPSAPTYSEN